MKSSLWIILTAFLLSCSTSGHKNEQLEWASNPKADEDAILFYTHGDISVPRFNVAIVTHGHTLTNEDTSNVFSYTWSDTIKIKKDTLITISWPSPTELVISHPKSGTFWKKKTSLAINGNHYTITYKEK